MMLSEFLHSVEDVWVTWLLSIGVLSLMVFRSMRLQHWRSVDGFLNDERGASYALAYLMTFPFYLLLVCLVIQSTMILIVKIGVMHAAHTSVRSAVVWRCADPFSSSAGLKKAEEKAQSAAAVAIVPYASGLKGHTNVWSINPASYGKALKAMPKSIAYELLYKQLAKHSEASRALADTDFVRRKYVYAAAMTNVTLSRHSNLFNEKLSATVRFRMPIHIPMTGRVLGALHWSGWGYYRDIEATATLPLETPESPDQKLGINYDSSLL